MDDVGSSAPVERRESEAVTTIEGTNREVTARCKDAASQNPGSAVSASRGRLNDRGSAESMSVEDRLSDALGVRMRRG